MKKGAVILLVAVALGVCMFFCTRLMLGHLDERIMPTEHGSRLPELGWLRHSYKLTDSQFESIRRLHAAYLPTCEKLCARVQESDARVLHLGLTPGQPVSAELAAALRERGQLAAECQEALLKHIHETAACMDAEQAALYRARMIPHALGVSCCATPEAHTH
jgi:hypothetical protein